MKIVIIGAGEVGFHVAKALSQENFDITVIEIELDKCRRIAENLDVIVVEGHGASPRNLTHAKVQEADYVLCVTGVDEVNLIASQQAHEMGAKKIIARLRNQQYSTRESIIKPERFGIDLVIHPEKAACQEIVRLVRRTYATQVMEFEGGRVQLLGIRINNRSPIIGKSVAEVNESSDNFKFGIVTVLRNGKSYVPWGDFIFQERDVGYFLVRTDRVDDLMHLLGKNVSKTRRIMIMGGSKIGRSVAEELQNEMSVRLVEIDRYKAETIATTLENTMILNGDGTDVEFLRSENVSELDSFIAVAHNEQTNLLSALLAKHLGVKQTICHISTTEYLPIIKEIGLDAVISKNISTVNAILRFIRSAQLETAITTFDEIDVDVLEFNPEPGSKVTTKTLQELHFPEESIVGVINHHGALSIARGTSQITEEDTVLVFAKQSAIPKLKKLFNA